MINIDYKYRIQPIKKSSLNNLKDTKNEYRS